MKLLNQLSGWSRTRSVTHVYSDRKKSPWLSWRASGEEARLLIPKKQIRENRAYKRHFTVWKDWSGSTFWCPRWKSGDMIKSAYIFFLNGAITHVSVYFSTKPEIRSHWHTVLCFLNFLGVYVHSQKEIALVLKLLESKWGMVLKFV